MLTPWLFGGCAKWLDKEELFGYEISRDFLQPLEPSGSLVCGLA